MRTERSQSLWLWTAAGVLLAGTIAYSQTLALAWDEGFHMLAAQLIAKGMRPYIDFFFPQAPLYTYFNGELIRIFGAGWRAIHVVSAAALVGAALLAALFVFHRLEDERWRLTAALCTLALVGLNSTELWYGTIGQPYAIALLLVIAAFRLAILAVDLDERSLWICFAAGLCAASAAASTLLTAPFAPALLVWIWLCAPNDRWKRAAAYLAGIVPPLLPLLSLFIQGPRQVLFGVFQYHALYREADWPDAKKQNLDVAMAWMNNYEAVLLIGLAALGLTYIAGRSNWAAGKKREFYLCVWLTGVESAYLCIPRPTFGRYYLFVIPFLAILASVGLYAIAAFIGNLRMPWRYPLILSAILIVAFVKYSADDINDYSWKLLEQVARKVAEVTPQDAPLLADEEIYFLTRHTPPSGMEYMDSHKLDLPAELSGAMHLVSLPSLKQEVIEGKFATVSICNDKDREDALGLPARFAQKAEIQACSIYWDWRRGTD